MNIFSQVTIAATDNHSATQAAVGATMAASMAMMPTAETCQNQQQPSQRQSQGAGTPLNLFIQAENTSVFCFFYSYQSIPHYSQNDIKRSLNDLKRS